MNEKLGKKERTKRLIVSTAISLFNEQGVDQTSMEQIFTAAEIAKGTLYNHFSNKDEIIATYIETSFLERETVRFDKFKDLSTTKERLVYIFSELITGIEKNKDLFEKYLIFRMKDMVSITRDDKSGFSVIAIHIVEEGQKNNEIRNDIPLSFILDFFDFIFIEIIKQSTISESEDAVTLIDNFTDIFIKGLKKV